MLGVFPSLDCATFGGIEESGRTAWRGLSGMIPGSRLFCYSPSGDSAAPDRTGTALYARTKTSAVWAALSGRWPANTVLFWHIGLLQLLPFLRVGNAPVALFLHGIEAWPRHSYWNLHLLRRVSLFLSNSEYTWLRFIAANPEFSDCPHRTVHLGLGEPLPEPAPVGGRSAAVLMIGRMQKREDYKGHREMIAAWQHVIARNPDAELWIAGTGSLQGELERLARKSAVRRSIRFFGRVSEEKKNQLLSQCRCLALPSRAEGFGLVYLEAMRTGTPCLVSTLDAGREVVDPPEAGLAADPENPQELADAACRLITPGADWDQFSERAKSRYHTSFTATHFQQRLAQALKFNC